MNYKKFQNKRVVIAGGASGIGQQIAYLLADHGASVVIVNRNGDSLESFRKNLASNERDISTYAVDMQDTAQVEQLGKQLSTDPIDYFFNCVGMVQGSEILDTLPATAIKLLDTNVNSVVNGTYVFYGVMAQQGFGHIINFASAAGLLPTPFMATYTMSKYGIVGYTHALRAEARSRGVKASVVCPGFVKTAIYDKAAYNKLDKHKVMDVLFNKVPIQSPEQAARRIVRGVSKNKATIHTWYSLQGAWLLYRAFPNVYLWTMARISPLIRKHFT